MSVAAEIGTAIKKMFLVSEELTRLSTEVKDLSRDVHNHEVRLAVVETTLSISHHSSKKFLSGN